MTATAIPVRDLPVPERHPKVVELHDQVDHLRREAIAAEGKLPGLRERVASAQAALDDVRVEVVLGTRKAADEQAAERRLEAARTALREAEDRARAVRAAAERTAGLVGPLLDGALDEAQARFHVAYAERIARLDALLEQASAVNEEIFEILDAAVDVWGTDSHPRASGRGSHPSFGGLMRMEWVELVQSGQRSHRFHIGGASLSKLEQWREDARDRGWLK